MRNTLNISSGMRFGKLLVLGQSLIRRGRWDCQCRCGNITTAMAHDLVVGKKISCCCHKRATTIERNKRTATRGGLTHTATGGSWNAMMARCHNHKYHCYPQYGGRGIVACQFMQQSPKSIISLIGERPHGKSLDRIDNSIGYTCGSCDECKSKSWRMNIRWATRKEQSRNQTTNRKVTINGITRCVSEWAELCGLHDSVIRFRLKRGWTGEMLIAPKQKFSSW